MDILLAKFHRAVLFLTTPFLLLTACLATTPAMGALIFFETFDNGNLGGTGTTGPQFETGLDLSSGGDIAGWTEAGAATAHAVDLDSGSGTDFSVMIWSGFGSGPVNVITLENGISANALGSVYDVSFDVSAAVFMNGSEATTASESLLINILRADDSILASYNSFAGAWTGAMSFSNDGFSYSGDGTGQVKIQITSADPGIGIFAGAIDNVAVSSVPVPAAAWLFGSGLIGLIGIARHKKT